MESEELMQFSVIGFNVNYSLEFKDYIQHMHVSHT